MTLVDKLVQFILAHHKTECLPHTPDDPLPSFLVNAERYLIRITNPYVPSEESTLATQQTARHWVNSTLTLLKEHYRRLRASIIADITPLLVPAWNRALLVAIRQARKKTPAIRETSIDATRTMLTCIMSPSFPLPGTAPPPPQPATPDASHLPRPSGKAFEPQLQGSTCPDLATTPAILPPPPPMEPPASAADRPPPPLSPVISIIHSNSDNETRSFVRPLALSPPPLTPEAKKGRFDIDSLDDGYLRSLLDNSPMEVSSPLPAAGQPPTDIAATTPLKPSGSLRQVPLFATHPHHGDKYKNWSLSPRRPLIIMGDSNLARLPAIPDVRVQVDSFPGAKIAHAANILRHKTKPCPMVTTAILSFGINDKDSANPSLLTKSLGSLYNAAKTAFPNAIIYMPLLNCSHFLPPHIQQHVTQLNDLIKSYNSFIPRLATAQFRTTNDNVHWTPETARQMWKHWRDFLE